MRKMVEFYHSIPSELYINVSSIIISVYKFGD